MRKMKRKDGCGKKEKQFVKGKDGVGKRKEEKMVR